MIFTVLCRHYDEILNEGFPKALFPKLIIPNSYFPKPTISRTYVFQKTIIQFRETASASEKGQLSSLSLSLTFYSGASQRVPARQLFLSLSLSLALMLYCHAPPLSRTYVLQRRVPAWQDNTYNDNTFNDVTYKRQYNPGKRTSNAIQI